VRALWIGLVEVRRLPDSKLLKGRKGAFVNVITWASTAVEFRRKVESLATSIKLFVVQVEDAEPLSQRKRTFAIDEELEALADEAYGNPNAILYGTFHTYRRDEA